MSVFDIAQTGSEAEPKQVAESEDMIGGAASVGVVLSNLQFRLMIEQAVKHVRCLARGCSDDLGVKRPELIGDVRIEGNARLVAVTRIDVADRRALTAGAEILSVRR